MKTAIRPAAALLLLLMLAACEQGGGSGPAASGAWLGDYDAALKEAKASNRPILMDIGADW